MIVTPLLRFDGDGAHGGAVGSDEREREDRDKSVFDGDLRQIGEVLDDDAPRLGDEVMARKTFTWVLVVRGLVEVDRVDADGAHASLEEQGAGFVVEVRVIEV